MPEVITDNLDLWTSALLTKSTAGRGNNSKLEAYGIKKLRELILELAVRGKLVPQDASDEPASELLKRIQTEKMRLIAEGKIKKDKPLPPITEDEKSFGLPHGWEWVRLGMLGEWGAGATPTRGNSKYFGGDIPWFKSGELTADYISQSEETVTELALKECSLRANSVGDVLVAMYGATIGKTAILSVPATTNQAVCACTPFNGIANRYLLLLLKALKPNFIGQGAGGAQPNISREKIIATITALPPLAEQHRIVAKVDELMALCDQLEQQQTHSIEAHQTLVASLLGTLTRVESQQEFSAAWARIASHFDTLFTTEASIDQLKQTILQLAVMGKLVPQDPNDEDVQVLLMRNDLRRREVTESDRRADVDPQNILSADDRWEIPASWNWRGLADLVLFVDYRGKTPTKQSSGIRLLTAKNVRKGQVDLMPEEFLTEQEYKAWMTRGLPKVGDVLFTTEAPMGNAAVVELTEQFALAQRVICFQCYGALDPAFLVLQMLSAQFQYILDKNGTGMTAKGIKASKLKRLPIAIPPLAEQHRIVAKVDELMALCDTLKARLADAQTIQLHLADAIVEQAVC